jgi:hypothetical protein
LLSSHWKSKIVVEALPIYQRDSNIVTGMYHDPAQFIPNHMVRWLERKEMEGKPLSGGFYKVKFKVIYPITRVQNFWKILNFWTFAENVQKFWTLE